MELRPTSEFDHNLARNKLASLTLSFGDEGYTRVMLPGDTYDEDDAMSDGRQESGLHGQMLRLSGCVPLDSGLTVCLPDHTERLCVTNWNRSAVLEPSSPICSEDVLRDSYQVMQLAKHCSA